jgi:hypothetical protein
MGRAAVCAKWVTAGFALLISPVALLFLVPCAIGFGDDIVERVGVRPLIFAAAATIIFFAARKWPAVLAKRRNRSADAPAGSIPASQTADQPERMPTTAVATMTDAG